MSANSLSFLERVRSPRARSPLGEHARPSEAESDVLAALDFEATESERSLPSLSPTALHARRAIDSVVAAVSVVLALPVFLLIALAVKATSSGPVFFRQVRVGRHGSEFEVLKFRTMRDGTHVEVLDCEVSRQAYRDNDFKLPPDDPRITRVGRLLRKSSLDELPQLINVLRGQMSIVGIRPLLAEEIALRPERDQQLYAMLRPGLTGLWQVEGRSTVGSADRLALDRAYVETWSVWNDIKIIIRTPFAVLRLGHAH